MNAPTLAPYDLHLHTYWSYDAVSGPRLYFDRAHDIGARCIAITDHHIIDAFDEIRQLVADYPDIRWIPAAELSVVLRGEAFDLLCYGFPDDLPADLAAVLKAYQDWQLQTGTVTSEGLCAQGVEFDDAARHDLLASYRPAHVMAAQGDIQLKGDVLRKHLLDHQNVDSSEELSALFKNIDFPHYPNAADVVPPLKQAGILIALAHPTAYFHRDDRERMDMLRIELQLDGIECAHPLVPPELTPVYRAYCQQHGLFSVAGSDCHAPADIEPLFARHGGEPEWLDEFLERLP